MQKVTLERGKVYKHKNGQSYKVVSVFRDGACVKNVASGWGEHVYGITMNDSGEIAWEYSNCGRFML